MKKKKKVKFDSKELYAMDIPLNVFDEILTVMWGNQITAVEYCEGKGCVFSRGADFAKSTVVDGFCIQDDQLHSFIYIGNCLKNYGTICHELTHGILNMMDNRGLLLSGKGGQQELGAYVFGYVMGNVLSAKDSDWYQWTGKAFK